jgi:hypothetical protein
LTIANNFQRRAFHNSSPNRANSILFVDSFLL